MKKLITFSTALLFLLGQLTQPLFARNYDPIISKFVSVDPLMTELTPEQKEHYKRFLYDPQEGNSYNYVLNNPIKYTDPDGLSPCLGLCTLAVIGIASVAMSPIEIGTKNAETKANVNMTINAASMTAPFTKMFSWLKSKIFPASTGAGIVSKSTLRPMMRSVGAAGDDMLLKKAVNSNLPHAIERGVERNIFSSADEAGTALRGLTNQITKSGTFPKGTLVDTAREGRFLVPVGNNGRAVYQLGKNGTAKLKTVLIER